MIDTCHSAHSRTQRCQSAQYGCWSAMCVYDEEMDHGREIPEQCGCKESHDHQKFVCRHSAKHPNYESGNPQRHAAENLIARATHEVVL